MLYKTAVRYLLVLLCIFCGTQNDAITTQLPAYPCDNQILFGFENSKELDVGAFQKQVSFLVNYTFEKWTHFNYLAIDSSKTACDVFSKLTYGMFSAINTKIILFLNEFDSSDIIDECVGYLKGLILNENFLLFVPLSGKFNQTVLKHYYSQANIIEWDILNNATPANWEKQFDDFYDCGDQTTTTAVVHSSTTESPINFYPPCNPTVAIALDKSNGYTDEKYQEMKDFLTSHVFKNWTQFNKLNLITFAEHVYSNIAPFKDVNELAEFVESEEQIDSNPDLCNLLYYYYFYVRISSHFVIFLSTLNGTDFKETMVNRDTCQGLIDKKLNVRVTIVLLNDALNIDTLRQHIPQVQFIKLNLSDVETNWEWSFNTAYGCNEDDYNDRALYPCNSKFIVGYEVSSEMDQHVLNAQKDFLANNIFNKDWNVFNNLALIAYSNNTQIKDFGTLNDLNSVHSFVDNSMNQNNTSRTSLCNLFKQLTTMYLFDVNIILFVSQFHERDHNDECSIWIKQLRNNLNSINFVSLTKQVSTEYLASKFSQAIFTDWDTTANEMPNKWGIESYGCQNFVVTSKRYPGKSQYNTNSVIFDKSRYLSPFAYQRLTNFLQRKVFIQQWTDEFEIYNYPDIHRIGSLDRIEMELFIRQSLKSNTESLFCPILNEIVKSNDGTLLFFINIFDEGVFKMDEECKASVDRINTKFKTTFIKIGKLVNDTLLLDTFTNITIIDWNIEQDDDFLHWNQVLWEAFGCYGTSPIVLPINTTSTPTLSPKTHALSTTTPLSRISSTTVVLSKQTTKQITSTTTTARVSTLTTTTLSNTPNLVAITVGIFVPLFIISLLAVVACFCLYRRRKRNQRVDNMAFRVSNRNTNEYIAKRDEEEDLWELAPENVELFDDKQLGSGASANVYLGKLYGDAGIRLVYPDIIELREFRDCKVAIKVLPTYATELNKEDFKQEICFMKNLKHHSNIICLLGYTTDQIVLEYCKNGDLMHFLRHHKEQFETEEGLKQKDLISFAWQISNGMDYFSSLGLVHRDLAARNILLTKENICKISDFGLAREGDVQSYTSKRRMPVRWFPPEALKSFEYSTKTDVWSYGILLYEIFTIGCFPYSELENTEILSFIDSGNRLEQPSHASDDVYNIMTTCWSAAPTERPSFTDICQRLIPLLEQFNINYNYVDPTEAETNDIFEIESEEVEI